MKLIPEHFITSNYKEVFSAQYSFVRWYFNTFVMVGTILVLKVGIVTLTAYAFARLRFKGRDILFVVLLSSMMIPPDAVIIPKYVIFKAFGITDLSLIHICMLMLGNLFRESGVVKQLAETASNALMYIVVTVSYTHLFRNGAFVIY